MSPALPMGTGLEEGEGGELDARVGGSGFGSGEGRVGRYAESLIHIHVLAHRSLGIKYFVNFKFVLNDVNFCIFDFRINRASLDTSR